MVLPKGVQKYKKNIKQDRGPYIYYSTDTVFQALSMQESQNVNPGGIGKPILPFQKKQAKKGREPGWDWQSPSHRPQRNKRKKRREPWWDWQSPSHRSKRNKQKKRREPWWDWQSPSHRSKRNKQKKKREPWWDWQSPSHRSQRNKRKKRREPGWNWQSPSHRSLGRTLKNKAHFVFQSTPLVNPVGFKPTTFRTGI